ncbi:PEP-CTERM sorting domain-containing protein [Aestuariicella hydrocarbonica]|uniref:PEP-CTERM sorting domain-containing protein n=1 Tax=Pseudomaricurvus hydrocarbonicus TaxID=1470433 RepID=A0A9E5JQ51_9GAMM|nr:PEP-CTERM sorting domain-containing protein [Aestuariicella hydrocarbonica]NHO64563.1 PEP-CTERM sorting domain-containing protein [Aestuariicella hydrocarbonica]
MNKYLFALLILLPLQSQALLINTSVGDYNVSTVTGTYSDLSGTLNSNIWMNNGNLALEFSTAAGTSLGDPGPLFLFSWGQAITTFPNGQVDIFQSLAWAQEGFTNGCSDSDCFSREYIYAVASAVTDNNGTVPVPSSLLLLLAGLLGMTILRRT